MIKQGVLLATPFATVTVDAEGERGLLGVAFDPNFSITPYMYVYYTVPAGGGRPVHNRVSRFTAAGDVAVSGSEVVLLELDDLTTTLHNGGALDFGPNGKLYIAIGNDAIGTNSRSLSTRLGKMLRVDADGSIPADNPFYLTAAGPNRAIWAYGLRNPFKFAVNPNGGDPAMLINNIGGSQFEEVNDGVAGVNYGYPHNEGYVTHPDYQARGSPPITRRRVAARSPVALSTLPGPAPIRLPMPTATCSLISATARSVASISPATSSPISSPMLLPWSTSACSIATCCTC